MSLTLAPRSNADAAQLSGVPDPLVMLHLFDLWLFDSVRTSVVRGPVPRLPLGVGNKLGTHNPS